ncbi:MFS transporter [Corynebacterium incognita]|uniref:MFS transporter n=1 Tax=Corynebacterium incognita TaxID=2754725 RepID=A0A7G7CPB4_9CORY|nr:MFS transporter [Corynebacterium incognita]QNE89430.1 MFS transporter [Corynebacterium incognita]
MNNWRALGALSLGFFVSLLDQSMVAVAIPAIQHEFGTSIGQTLWVSSIYLLAVVIPLLVTGRLGDVLGPKRMFCLGVSVFGAGAILAATAPTIEVLIAARAIQGLGASIQMPQSMAVINRIFPREQRGRALGVWGIVGSLASLAGPLAGGFITDTFGWHGVFWLPLPFAVAAVVLAMAWVPSLPTHARTIDPWSVVWSMAAMGSLVFGIQELWWVALASPIFFLLFLRRRSPDPLVPRELFRDRNYSIGAFSIATMGFMAASMMLPVMVRLQEEMSPDRAGLMMAPMAIVSMAVTPFAGVMVDKYHPRTLSQFGFGVVVLALVLLDVVLHLGTTTWVVVPVGLLGFGQAFIWGTNSATTMRDIPPRLMGAGSGVYNTTRQVGSVVGVAAVSAAMQANVDSIAVIIAVVACGFVAVSFFRDTLKVDLR